MDATKPSDRAKETRGGKLPPQRTARPWPSSLERVAWERNTAAIIASNRAGLRRQEELRGRVRIACGVGFGLAALVCALALRACA